ncbi:hypothetical protein Tco_1216251 [Tanacetum coccineum]
MIILTLPWKYGGDIYTPGHDLLTALDISSHCKVFANMKKAGKDFSRRIKPLLDTMMVQAYEEVGEDSDHPTDSNKDHIMIKPSYILSKHKKKQKSLRENQRKKRRLRKSKGCSSKRDCCFEKEGLEVGKEEEVKNYRFEETKESCRAKLKVVTTAATTTTTTTRPKVRGVVVQELSEFRTSQESQPSITKDKRKAIMVEPEVPLKRKDQVSLDEQMERDVQAQLEAKIIEEERLERQKQEEANIALIKSWENTQAVTPLKMRVASAK